MKKRYEHGNNYVPAVPQQDTFSPPTTHPISEPVAQAIAFTIRLLPWAGISAFVTWGIVGLTDLDTSWALVIWGGIVSGAYVLLAYNDSRNTPGALRAREINALRDVRITEHELADDQHRREMEVRLELGRLKYSALHSVNALIDTQAHAHSQPQHTMNQVAGYVAPTPELDTLRTELLSFIASVYDNGNIGKGGRIVGVSVPWAARGSMSADDKRRTMIMIDDANRQSSEWVLMQKHNAWYLNMRLYATKGAAVQAFRDVRTPARA